MYHLHWLPIDKQIDFKVLMFVHKIIHKCHVPDYLNHLVEIQPNQNRKRSVNAFKAVTLQSKNSYGDRVILYSRSQIMEQTTSNTMRNKQP